MVHRVPIKIERSPFKLTQTQKMQIKFLEVQNETREDDILVIARHYEMMAREVLQRGGYSSLSKENYTKHKNWIHFERVYEICRLKDWSTKLYVESQFDRAKNWISMPYPQPSSMYSVAALKHFTKYLAIIQLKHKQDTGGKRKEKGSETVSLRAQVVEEIIKTVESLSHYVELSDFDDKAQYKAFRIYNHWEEMSPYYLWSIPWFHDIIPSLADTNRATLLREVFLRISGSPSLQDTVIKAVQQIEDHFSIPPNISLG